jgi:phasin family protein
MQWQFGMQLKLLRFNFCALHHFFLTMLQCSNIWVATKEVMRTMASKSEALSTKAPAKAEAKASKPKPLVTRIVSVDEQPEVKGTTKMTEAATKATEFFADIKEKAGEAAEKGKAFAATATEFSKANMEALVEAGKIAAKGAQELGQTNIEFAKSNFAEVQAAVKEVTTVKSPTEFVKLQSDFAKKGFDIAVAQASKNTEAFVKLANDMFQPISNRIAVAAETFKKAA